MALSPCPVSMGQSPRDRLPRPAVGSVTGVAPRRRGSALHHPKKRIAQNVGCACRGMRSVVNSGKFDLLRASPKERNASLREPNTTKRTASPLASRNAPKRFKWTFPRARNLDRLRLRARCPMITPRSASLIQKKRTAKPSAFFSPEPQDTIQSKNVTRSADVTQPYGFVRPPSLPVTRSADWRTSTRQSAIAHQQNGQ